MVQEMALRGELPGAARIGGVWTFDPVKLAAFVKQREVEAVAPPRARSPAPVVMLAPRRQRPAKINAAYRQLLAERLSRPAA